MSTDPWIWIMGLLMLGIFSFLIKENPFYRWVEHVYVGAAAGYGLSMGYNNILTQAWDPLVVQGKLMYIIPVILGIMAYARFIKPISWLSRWPMALIAGAGAGSSIYGATNSSLVAQVKANLLPLNSFDNIFMVVGVLAVMVYFLFSRDQKGPVKHFASGGRMLLMVTFGVSFGNVIMGRISLLLGALQSIFGKWLGIISL
jgi:lipoprotein signal peptidase